MAVRTQLATVGNRGRHSSNPSDPFNLGRPGGSLMDPAAPNPFATPDFVTPAPSAPSQSSRSSGYFPEGKPPRRIFHVLVQLLTLPIQYRHLEGDSRARVLLGSMVTRLIQHGFILTGNDIDSRSLGLKRTNGRSIGMPSSFTPSFW